MDDFDETFFDSDENPFDLASLLPRRTALDKDKQIADNQAEALGTFLRVEKTSRGFRWTTSSWAIPRCLHSCPKIDIGKGRQQTNWAWRNSSGPWHLKSIAIKMIAEHNFTAHGELMAYRLAHTKAAELLGLGALGMGAFALETTTVANDTILQAAAVIALMAAIAATIGVAAIRNRSPSPILDKQRSAYISLLSYLSNPHGNNQYGQMDPLETQSYVNKLFKRGLIVAILWNARRSISRCCQAIPYGQAFPRSVPTGRV
jgi:hypothetical protein